MPKKYKTYPKSRTYNPLARKIREGEDAFAKAIVIMLLYGILAVIAFGAIFASQEISATVLASIILLKGLWKSLKVPCQRRHS